MSDVYARDALARPLRLLAGMLSEIRNGSFVPDAGRAARFPGRLNEADLRTEVPEAVIRPVVDVDLTSETGLKAPGSEAGDMEDEPTFAGSLLQLLSNLNWRAAPPCQAAPSVCIQAPKPQAAALVTKQLVQA